MKEQHPVTIVILGGTGDLAEHKLIPALYDLRAANCLPEDFFIVGFSRKALSDVAYQQFIETSLIGKGKVADAAFITRGRYKQGDLTQVDSYRDLATYLYELDESLGVCTNKLFYLAVPPTLYEPVCTNIAAVGLTVPCKEHAGDASWSRLLIEKPFGDDRAHAEYLDVLLGKLFDESQIFRIDHYLAKETLQNVLAFRFSNPLFASLWSSNAIASIDIELLESFGIKKRAGFYNGIGALRDVGQNHILQMLALIAMEEPHAVTAAAIRDARADVLEQVKLHGTLADSVVRGQYSGYRDTEGVPTDSQTETFFSLILEVASPRWYGTRFTVRSGKALYETCARITVHFKEKISAWATVPATNTITFMIQPNESISVRFLVKRPGFTEELIEKELTFAYPLQQERLPDAYERVLFDALRGDQTLFPSTREVQAQWNIIMPILEQWGTLPLRHYEQGVHPQTIEGSM